MINTNTASLLVLNHQRLSQTRLETAHSRLASGLRINSAQDDAAGQGITNRMTAHLNGFVQAQRNANDGISLAQTAEGALNQINSHLLQIRRLTVQALNDTNSSTNMDAILAEIAERLEEIDSISTQSQFNGASLLGEAAKAISIQVSSQDGHTIPLGLETTNVRTLGLGNFNSFVNTLADMSALLNSGYSNLADASTLVEKGYVEGTTVDGVTPYSSLPPASIQDVLSRATRGTQYDPDESKGGYAHSGLAGQQGYYFSPDETAYFQATGGISGSTEKITSPGTTSLVYDDAHKLYIRETIISENIVKTRYYTVDSGMVTDGAVESMLSTRSDFTEEPLTGGQELDLNQTYSIVLHDTSSTHDQIAAAFKDAGYNDNNIITIDGRDYHVESDGTIIEKDSGKVVYVESDGTLTTDTSAVDVLYELEDGSINTHSDGSGSTLHIAPDGSWIFDQGYTTTKNPLSVLDNAIQAIDARRSELGAVQNRLATAIDTLQSQQVSLHASRSRIVDADYSEETINLTKERIRLEVGSALLAQANAVPRGVIALLL